MHIVEKPKLKVSAVELFVLCVNSYQNEDYQKRLLGYSDRVRRHSAANEKQVPFNIHAYLQEVLPEQVPKEEMEKVYNDKLRDGSQRDYYEEIRGNTPDGKCLICGVDTANTLDHYLQKSQVPTLAVDPGNLIPTCSECNGKKGDKLCIDPCDMPIHNYYDKIPAGKWLHAKVGAHLEADYYISCPKDWDPVLRIRLGKHLDSYKLHKKYSLDAVDKLSHLQSAWKTEQEDLEEENEGHVTIEEMKKKLYHLIRKNRRTEERRDENSSAAAYYRGLEANIDLVYQFFGLKEPIGAGK
jgi:5-methylcytosine-specific restriction endonuclease McrA